MPGHADGVAGPELVGACECVREFEVNWNEVDGEGKDIRQRVVRQVGDVRADGNGVNTRDRLPREADAEPVEADFLNAAGRDRLVRRIADDHVRRRETGRANLLAEPHLHAAERARDVAGWRVLREPWRDSIHIQIEGETIVRLSWSAVAILVEREAIHVAQAGQQGEVVRTILSQRRKRDVVRPGKHLRDARGPHMPHLTINEEHRRPKRIRVNLPRELERDMIDAVNSSPTEHQRINQLADFGWEPVVGDVDGTGLAHCATRAPCC